MSDVLAYFDSYPVLATLIGVVVLTALAVLANWIARRFLITVVHRIVRETPLRFDDRLLEFHVFGRLAHMAPALAVYYGIRFVPVPRQVSALIEIDSVIEEAAAAAVVLIGVSAGAPLQEPSGSDLAQLGGRNYGKGRPAPAG